MVCEYCGSETKVINSRLKKRHNKVWRRRACTACNAVFTTTETSELGSSWIFVSNGNREPFSRERLLISLYESLKHRKNAAADSIELTETVIARLRTLVRQGEIDTLSVKEAAYVCLTRFDKTAGTLYMAFRDQRN